MKRIFTVMCGFLFVLGASTVNADTMTLTALEDSWVMESSENTNYNDNFLRATNSTSSSDEWSYVKFDLSEVPDNADISMAAFSWYNFGASWDGNTPSEALGITLFHVSDDTWTESVITWNNKPSYGANLGKMTPGGYQTRYTAYLIYDAINIDNWDESVDLSDNVLSLVLNTLDDEYMKSYVAYSSALDSPEYTWGPKLYIEYTAPQVPIPGAVWLLGSGLIGLLGFRRKLRK